jgi:hypothetical protein
MIRRTRAATALASFAILAVPFALGCSSKSSAAAPGAPPAPLLLGSSKSPSAIAVDATRIYWVDDLDGTVLAAKLDGTGQVSLASGQDHPMLVAADAGDVFWVNVSSAGSTVTLVHLPPEGTPVQLYTGIGYPTGLALDATHAYLALTRTDNGSDNFTGAIFTIPRAGGPPTAIATSQAFPLGFAKQGTSVYWANLGTPTGAFSDYTGGTLNVAPETGGAATELATGIGNLFGLAVGSSIFISSRTDPPGTTNAKGTLISCPLAGCGKSNGAATTLITGAPAPYEQAMVADGDTLYYALHGDDEAAVPNGAIMKVSASAPTPAALVSARRSPCRVVLDAANVYWLEGCAFGVGAPPVGIFKAPR